MCLDFITRRVKPSKKVRKVCKRMLFHRGGPHSSLRNGLYFPVVHINSPAKCGVWLRAKEKRLNCDESCATYRSGFHCYPTNRLNYMMGNYTIRCEVKGIHTWGRQDGKKVLVARWIRFPKEGK